MGLNSESGEASCEDLDSRILEEIVQENSDIDRMLKDSDDEVPRIVILDDSDVEVVVTTNKHQDSNVDRTSKTHACPYEDCDLVFNRPNRLANHLRCHEGKRVFKCEVPGCEKAYFSSSHLHRHVAVKHEPQPMYKQHFKCPHPDCLMELSNKHNLKRHYQRKHKQKYPFMCQYCDKGFSKHKQLRAHVYQHTGVPPLRPALGTSQPPIQWVLGALSSGVKRPDREVDHSPLSSAEVKCSTCNVGFTYQRELKRHERGHNTHVCDCGQEFKYWSHIRTHKKLCHTTEFICDICKKCFKTKCRLRIHIVVHQDFSDRDVLPCPYENCPRFYYGKRNLDHHIRSSHEGKKYECTRPDCGMKLCTRKKLEYHMKLHDAKRPLPRRSHKARKRRCDAGTVKQRSMAVLLSGIVISREEEKALLNAKSDAVLEMKTENSIPVRNYGTDLEPPSDHETSRKCEETAVKEHDTSSRAMVSCYNKGETGFDALGAISVITLTETDPGICNKGVLLKLDDSETIFTKQMKDNVYEQSTPLMEIIYHISPPIHGTDVTEKLEESESFCVTNAEKLVEAETADACNEPTSQNTDEQYQKYLNSLKSILAKKQTDKGIVENCKTGVSYVLNNKVSDGSNFIIAKSDQGLLQNIPQCERKEGQNPTIMLTITKEGSTIQENKDVAKTDYATDPSNCTISEELNTDEANIIPSNTRSKTDSMFPSSSEIDGNKHDLVKMLDSDSCTSCLRNSVNEDTLSNNSYLDLENLQSWETEDSISVRPTLDVPVDHKSEINNSCGEMFQEDVSSQVGKRKRNCLQEIENVPSSDIAPRKHKRMKKEMEVDVETRLSLFDIPSQDCKKKLLPLSDILPQECEMEINACKGKALEGNTASCDILAQEFEGKKKALNRNVDTSLEVPSQKCEVKRKLLEKTVKRLHSLKVVSHEEKENMKQISEYDISHPVPQHGDIVGVPEENQVMKMLETNRDSFRGSNSFVSSCINEDVMACCKEDPVSVEDIDGKQVETIEETNPFYFQMSIKRWICIMQRIMEEMFPTIKNSFTNKSNSNEFGYKLNSP